MTLGQRQTKRKTFTHVKSRTNYQISHTNVSDIIYPSESSSFSSRIFFSLHFRRDATRRTSPIKSCRAKRTNVWRRKNPVALSARKEEDRCVDGEIQRASNAPRDRARPKVARKVRIRMRASRPGHIRSGYYDVSPLVPCYTQS